MTYQKMLQYKKAHVELLEIINNLSLEDKEKIPRKVLNKLKKDIVEKTVKYVEQIGKDFSCEQKKKKALEKSLEWMKEKKLNVSDTEIEILIESAVNCL